MPTKRLTDWDRSQLNGAFSHLLKRSFNSIVFPVPEEELLDLCFRQFPPAEEKALRLIRANRPELLDYCTWGCSFIVEAADDVVPDTFWRYRINCMPDERRRWLDTDTVTISTSDQHYSALIDFAEKYYKLSKQIQAADQFISELISCITTTGQIARVLPDEILPKLPHFVLNSLQDAERRSRVPRNFEYTEEELQTFCNAVALASISPETKKGMDAHCTTRNSKAVI